MNSAPRISFVSLGCPKALVDSERILTLLRAEGYELAGVVHIATRRPLRAGDVATVKIDRSDTHDLSGTAI